jgi:hypothetical protein
MYDTLYKNFVTYHRKYEPKLKEFKRVVKVKTKLYSKTQGLSSKIQMDYHGTDTNLRLKMLTNQTFYEKAKRLKKRNRTKKFKK